MLAAAATAATGSASVPTTSRSARCATDAVAIPRARSSWPRSRLGDLHPRPSTATATGSSPRLDGVHDFDLGEAIPFYLDPTACSSSTMPGAWSPHPTLAPPARRHAMARISFEDLAHSYCAAPQRRRTTPCKRLDITWQDGGAYALLGPSGCGKTTLLNIISGLLLPEPGPGAVRRPGRHRACRPRSATSPRCSSSRSSTTP